MGIDFASITTMLRKPEKILLVDEVGFMRVCSSMLEAEGYQTETILPGSEDNLSRFDKQNLSLVIASYPHGSYIFDSLKQLTVPVIVLSDHICEEVICLLQELGKSYCMTKPLDYTKFKMLVKQLMNGERIYHAGYDVL